MPNVAPPPSIAHAEERVSPKESEELLAEELCLLRVAEGEVAQIWVGVGAPARVDLPNPKQLLQKSDCVCRVALCVLVGKVGA